MNPSNDEGSTPLLRNNPRESSDVTRSDRHPHPGINNPSAGCEHLSFSDVRFLGIDDDEWMDPVLFGLFPPESYELAIDTEQPKNGLFFLKGRDLS